MVFDHLYELIRFSIGVCLLSIVVHSWKCIIRAEVEVLG